MFTNLLATVFLLLAAAQDIFAASAGCGKNPIQSGVKTVTVAGQQRQYTLKIPDSYNRSQPYKLIFGYHWRSGSMQNVAGGGYYGLESLAQGSAIFVAPQGLDAGWANTNGNDVTFTDQILDAVKSNLCIDEQQIFATGFSYGGAMSFSVACSRPDVFKAVAVISGAQLSGCNGGTKPVPYLGIHGVADSVLPINLGRALRDKFLQLNGCQSKSASEPTRGSGSHIKTTYECSRAPVTWIAHSGDHVADPRDTNSGTWAPGETWTFFNNARRS
ncbi:Alpha/Beta hydrolase protein [Ilyonectria destructans]|nr:Alpha/Beta hydrolase protein [Ilyonectria destructans]